MASAAAPAAITTTLLIVTVPRFRRRAVDIDGTPLTVRRQAPITTVSESISDGRHVGALDWSQIVRSAGERDLEHAEHALDDPDKLASRTELVVCLTLAHRVVCTSLDRRPQGGTRRKQT